MPNSVLVSCAQVNEHACGLCGQVVRGDAVLEVHSLTTHAAEEYVAQLSADAARLAGPMRRRPLLAGGRLKQATEAAASMPVTVHSPQTQLADSGQLQSVASTSASALAVRGGTEEDSCSDDSSYSTEARVCEPAEISGEKGFDDNPIISNARCALVSTPSPKADVRSSEGQNLPATPSGVSSISGTSALQGRTETSWPKRHMHARVAAGGGNAVQHSAAAVPQDSCEPRARLLWSIVGQATSTTFAKSCQKGANAGKC